MLPLIPIALSLLPEIGKWLGGARGGAPAAAVADVVGSVTGTADPFAADEPRPKSIGSP